VDHVEEHVGEDLIHEIAHDLDGAQTYPLQKALLLSHYGAPVYGQVLHHIAVQRMLLLLQSVGHGAEGVCGGDDVRKELLAAFAIATQRASRNYDGGDTYYSPMPCTTKMTWRMECAEDGRDFSGRHTRGRPRFSWKSELRFTFNSPSTS
jgi:hypothetical protein